MKRWWLWPAILLLCSALLYDSVHVAWVGRADVRVAFLVVDARGGQPLEGAVIRVTQQEGGFCEDREARELELLTDHTGSANRICTDCMSFGRQSGLKFTDTFAVHLPLWQARVTAEGYRDSEPLHLEESVYLRQTKRTGTGAAELVVRIALSPIL